jgi:Anti-sigma-D factor RsdA to sigma factor binding region
MSEPRDERIETNPDADLAEVLRDDALLDAIGASREPAFATLPDDDDVTRLLAAWQADAATYADERTGPPIQVPVEVPVPPATELPAAVPTPHRPRHARQTRGGRFAPRSAAAISAAAVAVVVVSVGGVAAAVTGSPLTPLKAVVSGLAPASEQDGAAAITRAMPRELASVRTDIREGHLDDARRKLTDVRERAEELAPGSDQANALVAIEVLEEQIEMAKQATPSATSTSSPSVSPTDSATPTPTPTPTGTATPTPSLTVEPTPSSNGNGLGPGRARSPGERPESPPGAAYDEGPPN